MNSRCISPRLLLLANGDGFHLFLQSPIYLFVCLLAALIIVRVHLLECIAPAVEQLPE